MLCCKAMRYTINQIDEEDERTPKRVPLELQVLTSRWVLRERKHRHIVLVEMALTLMINNGVPKHLWVEAFTTAVYLINRLPFSVINMQSPFSSLYGRDTFQGEITTLSETSDWLTLKKSSEHSSDSTVQGADNSSY